MKRSPLKRKAPLRASSSPAKPRKRLPAKRATERRSSRVRDEAYLAWCRLQPCAVGAILADRWSGIGAAFLKVASDVLGCSGRTEPDHERAGVGGGKKASDRRAWPCCQKHHGQRHDLTGVFRRWHREQLNEFIRERIAEANARYDAERGSKAAS